MQEPYLNEYAKMMNERAVEAVKKMHLNPFTFEQCIEQRDRNNKYIEEHYEELSKVDKK